MFIAFNTLQFTINIFGKRELTFTFAICYRPSVCRLSVVCNVRALHSTQPVKIFRNVSTPFGTFAICGHSLKILRRSSQENPSVGGFKRKKGSQI